MKNLLLFALLSSVSAFGQAYSDSVTQNSPGNYGRPVPFASVQVCNIADTATPCTQKVSTFTNDSLGVACTQSAGSGVLTGAPSSGANCNNPGIADANGNFTIYVVPGQYRICTYANNWLCQNVSIGGSGGGIPFACASAVNGSIVGMTSTTTSSCDPNGITDFIGHWTSQSYRAVGAFNGAVELTGCLPDPINPPDANSMAWLANCVPTPYYMRPWPSAGTVGQIPVLRSQTTGLIGIVDALDWLNAVTTINGTPCTLGSNCSITVGGTVEFQTNGVDNANCTAGACPLQNLVPGANCTITNTSGGNVTINCAGGAAIPQALNPTAPTLANQNAAGARSITYGIQGCEDGPTCAFHSTLVTATIANANAVPSVLLTAYGDTLYGYRCFNIYVTADSGARTGVPGLIANCVWKKYLDSGTNGNSIAATNTNTTQLDPFGLTIPLPGCNSIPKAPPAIDGPPCVGKAFDDEFTETAGVLGDANNPQWTQQNWGTTATTLTNGELVLAVQNVSGQNQYRYLTQPSPTPPWTVVCVGHIAANSTNEGTVAVVVKDSSGAKFITYDWGNNLSEVVHWTSQNTVSSTPFSSAASHDPLVWVYLKVQDNNTNLLFSHSADGVNYFTDLSEGRTAFLASPAFIGPGGQSSSATITPQLGFDYCRQTQ